MLVFSLIVPQQCGGLHAAWGVSNMHAWCGMYAKLTSAPWDYVVYGVPGNFALMSVEVEQF